MTLPEHIFVYGTLRKGVGHPMGRVLEAHARAAGRARFPGRLFDLGSYPAVIPDSGGSWVTGELYRIIHPQQLLPLLDRYEGCTYVEDSVEYPVEDSVEDSTASSGNAPGRYPMESAPTDYRRVAKPVLLEDGSTVLAWIYLYNRSTSGFPEIQGGDYLRRRETEPVASGVLGGDSMPRE